MKSIDEISEKRMRAINDFEKLCKYGEVGFYTSCEITQIFIIDNDDGRVFNYFTLVNFEEVEYREGSVYLTKKLLAINKKYKLGVLQAKITMEEAKALFKEIQNNKFTLKSKKCEIAEKLVLLPKQFVSSSWDFDEKLPVGNILKPNFWGDSYIIEFFCENKPLINKLSDTNIDKINKCISSIESISIDLVKVYERVENIIFQFPITLISCSYSLQRGDTLEVSVYSHPKLANPVDLVMTAKASLDNVTTGYANWVIKSNQTKIYLPLGDSNNLELNIAKADSDILLHQSLSNYIRSFGGLILVRTSHSKPRTIKTKNGEVSVSVLTPVPISVNRRKDDFFTQIRHRELQNDLLRNSGDCRVFDGTDRQEEAYQFIRDKITKYTNEMREICLWDPYLRAQDILETLYFQNTGISLRCINSLQKARSIRDGVVLDSEQDFYQFRNNELAYFKNHSNNLGINLEFRCQYDNYGTSFHDRFMILVPLDANELPIVYSLGTSVNSLGKSHHLIQRVTNARLIRQNFDIMWDRLDPRFCRIVLFPEDLK